ncbi:adenosylmethionine-8-amino-7-oxononanoate aminotransferase [Streptomyces umbrinus]|uniref:Adenosylmethionine-8-amino-7-oxononanoate aminotransferase n=1 Tax=Streptomyces umbrinus TaxID=67370 RepID=A0ABU0SNH4_9ACTN|nr:hypothetical protein [Streptomyces umbrinus]MDQ1025114.1 adenosylmethionine-8-amino-7-oxononanoate aminotransferase [Streptomyces umbrinus]
MICVECDPYETPPFVPFLLAAAPPLVVTAHQVDRIVDVLHASVAAAPAH